MSAPVIDDMLSGKISREEYLAAKRVWDLRANPRDASGRLLCNCGAFLADKDHECAECKAHRERERVSRSRELEVRKLDSRFHDCWYGRGLAEPITHPPRWDWARFDNQEFRRRSSRKYAASVQRWSPADSGLILSGPTGRGKTGWIVAWIFGMRDQTIARVRAGEAANLTTFAFISGPELSGARRRWKIGQESPLVEHALKHQVLFLDEVGFEPLSEELFYVIDHRYRVCAPTVITTGLRPKEFRERYGDAIYRRVAEGGAVVEDWPA